MKNVYTFLVKNWKTSLAGLLAAILLVLGDSGILNPEHAENIKQVYDTIGIVLVALMGFFSRDANVSSEDSGVK